MSAGLNRYQQQAVDTLEGDVFLDAGAGSGKTRTLAERFANAVLGEDDREPMSLEALLTITFTEKAAGELQDRVRRVLAQQGRADFARRAGEAWISTIHGLCGRLLRRHALEAGLDPGFRVLSEAEAGALRHEAFEGAARSVIAESGVEELMAAFGASTVRSSVISIAEDVRARGLDVDTLADAELTTAPILAARQAASDVRDVADRLQAFDQAAAVKARDALLARALDLEHIAGLDGDAIAPALLEATESAWLSRSGRPKCHDLLCEAEEIRCRLQSVAADAIALGFSAAFRRVLSVYDAAYSALKHERHSLDFEDLQLRTARLLEGDPELAERYRRRFRLLMVDEFQDTNALQMRVLAPLRDRNLCAVGDMKQSIYGFRHADVEVFRTVSAQCAEQGTRIPLAVNYRSHPGVLAAIDGLFAHQALLGDAFAPLEPGRAGGWRVPIADHEPRAEVVLVHNRGWEGLHWREAEAAAIAARLRELAEAGASPGDMVVLMRAMSHAETYAAALRAEGLPVVVVTGGAYFALDEVADLRAMLASVANPLDEEALVRFLGSAIVGAEDDELVALRRRAGKGPLWRALREWEEGRLAVAGEVLRALRQRQGAEPLGELLLDGCISLDYDVTLFASGRGREAWANVVKLARLAEEFQRVHPGDAGAFLRHLDTWERHAPREALAPAADGSAGAVRIMTVHGAKGLEFPIVAVADLGRSKPADSRCFLASRQEPPRLAIRLPKPVDREGDALKTSAFNAAIAAEEAREAAEAVRVLYVACTRAEELLILSGGCNLAKPPGGSDIDLVRQALGDASTSGPSIAVRTLMPEDEVPSPLGAACEPAVPPEDTAEALRIADDRPELPSVPGPASLPPTVSFSSLETYRACPRRFYLERLRGLGASPTSGSAESTRFGNALHAALRLLDREGPTLDRVRALCRLERLDHLSTAASAPVQRVMASLVAVRSSAMGERILAAGPSAREVPIMLPLEGTVLVGSLDVLLHEGETAQVIDYKSGSGGPGARDRHERQADCYALAVLASGAERVCVSFVKPDDAAVLETFEYEHGQFDELYERVAEPVRKMAQGEFGCRDGYDRAACEECAARGTLCRVTERDAG